MGNQAAKAAAKAATKAKGSARLSPEEVLAARRVVAEGGRVGTSGDKPSAREVLAMRRVGDGVGGSAAATEVEMDPELLAAMTRMGPLKKTELQDPNLKVAPVAEELPAKSSRPRTLPQDRSKVEPARPDEVEAQAGALTELQLLEVLRRLRTREPERVVGELSAETGVPAEQLQLLGAYLQYPRIVVNNVDDKFAAFEPHPRPLKERS